VRPPTAALVTRYAERFDARVGTDGHSVGSPLGAWLLVALAAPLVIDRRAAVEEVLGTDADDAHTRAVELLSRPHPAVAHAVAVWHAAQLVRPAFAAWLPTLTAVTTGPIPSQVEADRWAASHTDNLVSGFPLDLDDLTAIVLAAALATRVRWRVPFETVSSRMLMADLFVAPPPGSWATRVRTALATPADGHEVRVFTTDHAGAVGVHAAESTDGLIVVSVIGDPAVAAADVRAAAHDVATELVRARTVAAFPAPSRAHRLPIAGLPLGPGHAWVLSEHVVDSERNPETEVSVARLPAWSCSREHDLLDEDAPGVVDTLDALAALTEDAYGPVDVAAAQAARASYSATGFEAAAVTAMSTTTRGLPAMRQPHTQRVLTVLFSRPYACVAVALEPGSPGAEGWHGVPVFSAWIEELTEAEPGASAHGPNRR
jgi:hypothetical protein